MTLFGAYLGDGNLSVAMKDRIATYENWLGSELGQLAVHTGANGWNDWTGSVGWVLFRHQEVMADQSLHWSIPLIPDWGATMAQAARGDYDARYIDAAQKIAAATQGDGPIYIRTGWEFNADWSPKKNSAWGQPENYVEAFRNFVDAFRSVDDRFQFEWTPNIGDFGMNPADAYPGNDYVDVIGMDFYWDSQQAWSTKDPVRAWDWMVNQKYGLQWLEDFADANGKPTAYSEWGVNSPDSAYFIEQASKWFADHNVLFANYWESNAAFAGMLETNQYGDAVTEAFLALINSQNVPVDTPVETPVPDLPVPPAEEEDEPEDTPVETPAPEASVPPVETPVENDDPDHTGDTPPAETTPGTTPGSSSGSLPVGGTETVIPLLPLAIAAMGAEQKWHAGTSGVDRLLGTDGNDGFNGGGTTGDTMIGGKGDDRYNFYGGEIIVENDGEGLDSMTSWTRVTKLVDQVEYLYLTATYQQLGEGNDLANVIIGGTSMNIINGKGGNDWLTGGGGADIFIFEAGGGHDVITDFGATDVLTIYGNDWTSFGDVLAHLEERGDDTLVLVGNGDAVTLQGIRIDDLTAENFVLSTVMRPPGNDHYIVVSGQEQITELVGGGADTVTSYATFYTLADNIENMDLGLGKWLKQDADGNALGNTIHGGDANNVIHGRGGNDVIFGDFGGDLLYGDEGNDTLYGGAGDDSLFGDAGADTFGFLYETGMGVDRIKDFHIGQHDRIDLSGLLFNYDPVTEAITDFIRVTTDGNHSNLFVDTSGSGSAWTQLAIIENVTGLENVTQQVAAGTIIV